jgi:hypothetical protein
MADYENANSSSFTMPEAHQTPVDDDNDAHDSDAPVDAGSHQPEWTSQQLMAMIQDGQTLSPADRQRLEAHIQELKAQRALAQELAELERPQNSKKRTHHHTTPDPPRPSNSPDSDTDATPRKRHRPRGPKVRTVQTLRHTASLRKWGDWKGDIQRVFNADPYIYSDNDQNKIITALDYVDDDLKSLWTSHLTECPDDDKDWNAFLQWSKRNIAQGLQSESTLYKQYQRAKQRSDQPPREFNNYLLSLERDLDPKSEKEAAMAFYTRLDDDLQRQFDVNNIDLATTRSAMVDIAQRVWDGMNKRRRRPFQDHHESSSSTRPNQDPLKPPSKPPFPYPHQKDSLPKKEQEDEKPSIEVSPLKPPHRAKAKQNGLCFRCGGRDHWAASCPQPAEAIVQAVISSQRALYNKYKDTFHLSSDESDFSDRY